MPGLDASLLQRGPKSMQLEVSAAKSEKTDVDLTGGIGNWHCNGDDLQQRADV
jgi:hypothetical protein